MVPLAGVEAALHRLYIRAAADLRDEDRKKAIEIQAMLAEIERIIEARRRPLHIVDAAAGKAYVAFLAAELVLAPRGIEATVVAIERDARLVRAMDQTAPELSSSSIRLVTKTGDVADSTLWPSEPDLVVALHACGAASDAIVDQAVACRARNLLLVPCCTSDAVRADSIARARAEELEIPRHAEVRRRFLQAMVDAERTLRLEAAGYETTVVSFVPPTVTPHHLLWRARRVGEPGRMARAAQKLLHFQGR